jgi:excisionase family DNA binding protein
MNWTAPRLHETLGLNEIVLSQLKEIDMEQAISTRSVQVQDRTSVAVMHFEPLLDSTQAASLLRIHPKTLQKMARRGQIQGAHVGKHWRFRASELNDWIARQKRVG